MVQNLYPSGGFEPEPVPVEIRTTDDYFGMWLLGYGLCAGIMWLAANAAIYHSLSVALGFGAVSILAGIVGMIMCMRYGQSARAAMITLTLCVLTGIALGYIVGPA